MTMPRRALAVLFLATMATAQAAAQAVAIDPRGLPGTRILAGGGRLPDAIYERFVAAAGGKGASIVVIPTASTRADDPQQAAGILQRWQQAHPEASFTLLHTRDRDRANEEAFCEPLRSASGIWFGGGSQSRIASAYVGTRVEREVHALLRRGGVVGGSSAGTAIQTRTMIAGGMDPPRLATGFDCLPLAIADQHFLKRDRMPRLQRALAMAPGHFGVGIDEGTAIVVSGRRIDVVGGSEVVFVLPGIDGRAPFVEHHGNGDRLDLVAWQRAARGRGAGAWPPQELPPPTVRAGSLVLGGGGQLPDAILQRFVALAGGDDAHIVLIPTATLARSRKGNAIERRLRELGAATVETLTPEHPGDVRAQHVERLDRATGVWFGGGRQWRIVDAFEGTDVVPALHRVLRRGGVIGGSSAGATIQGELLVRGNPLGNRDMWCEGYERGFAFLPGCAVDQHFVARDRTDDLRQLIRSLPQVIGIGVDEGTAAVVTGSTLEVLGRSKVAIFDARADGASFEPTWLEPGNKWDLAAGQRR